MTQGATKAAGTPAKAPRGRKDAPKSASPPPGKKYHQKKALSEAEEERSESPPPAEEPVDSAELAAAAAEAELLDDQAVLKQARNTGRLPLLAFKGKVATKLEMIIPGSDAAKFVVAGSQKAVTGTQVLSQYGAKAKAQGTHLFILSKAEQAQASGKLQRDVERRDLDTWTAQYRRELAAIAADFEDRSRPAEEASPADRRKKAAKKAKPRKAAKGDDGGASPLTRRGGSVEKAVAEPQPAKKRKAKAPVEEEEEEEEEDGLEPPRKHKKSKALAQLPTLTTTEFLSMAPEAQRTYTMGVVHERAMYLMAREELPPF